MCLIVFWAHASRALKHITHESRTLVHLPSDTTSARGTGSPDIHSPAAAYALISGDCHQCCEFENSGKPWQNCTIMSANFAIPWGTSSRRWIFWMASRRATVGLAPEKTFMSPAAVTAGFRMAQEEKLAKTTPGHGSARDNLHHGIRRQRDSIAAWLSSGMAPAE